MTVRTPTLFLVALVLSSACAPSPPPPASTSAVRVQAIAPLALAPSVATPVAAPPVASGPGHDIAADHLLRLRPRPKHVLVVGEEEGAAVATELAAAGVDVRTISGATYRGEEGTEPMPRQRFDAVVFADGSGSVTDRPSHVALEPGAPLLRIARGVATDARGDGNDDELAIAEEQASGAWDVLTVSARRPLPSSSDGSGAWPFERDLVLDSHANGAEKTVRAIGYLVASPSGPARIELAHARAEASVVYLTGAVAERELRPRARPGTLVHDTNGALVHAPANTMLEAYGPGWSEPGEHAIVVGDSVVAVRGKARFLGRGPLPFDASRKGLAWSLEVVSVEKIYDRAWWAPHEARHLAHLAKAEEDLRAGHWLAAADELDGSVRELGAAIGDDASRFDWVNATRFLAEEARRTASDPTGMDCRETTFVPWRRDSGRPVPHPADLAIHAVYRRAYEDRMWALAKVDDMIPHDTATKEDAPVLCWWGLTSEDPGFPTARHRDVAKKLRSYRHELR